jgi:hypothetical protein
MLHWKNDRIFEAKREFLRPTLKLEDNIVERRSVAQQPLLSNDSIKQACFLGNNRALIKKLYYLRGACPDVISRTSQSLPWVMWDSDPRMTALARGSSSCKQETRLLDREGAPHEQTSGFVTPMGAWYPPKSRLESHHIASRDNVKTYVK